MPDNSERRQVNIEMIASIATMTQKLIQVHDDIISVKDDVNKLDIKVGIQNGRIFKLEKWQAFILGGVALLGVMGSMVTMAIMWFHK